ncbi:MAG TPA: CAP domain-containing protein [Mycobacteriales bacterium]|nr:CAP domain-containing protein [Mycobacteriales bacterium]
MRRPARLLATTVAAAAPLLGVLAPAALTTASASAGVQTVDSVRLNGYEASLAAKINDVRRSAGLRSLVVVPGATDVARRWAWHLAGAQALSHNPNLVSALEHAGSSAWTEIAENVGEASATDPGSLFSAYMASPPHKANILDPQARYLGVGVVERAGLAWNTLDFTNAYSTSYGRTRVPAPGLTMDRQTITTSTDVASLERPDQRFGTASSGRVSTSLVQYTGPTAGNDSAYARLVRHGRGGHADLLMSDALDLSYARTLQLQLAAPNPTGRPLYVKVWLSQAFGSSVQAAVLKVVSGRHWYTVTLPSAAQTYRTSVVLRVTSRALAAVGGKARLVLLDLRAGV